MRRYWYFDKAPDIARRYSFGESKVKSLLSRRRNRLKKFLIMGGIIYEVRLFDKSDRLYRQRDDRRGRGLQARAEKSRVDMGGRVC